MKDIIGKVLIVAGFALGFLCASWDTMLFYPLARGWTPVIYEEPSQAVAISEFISLTIIAVFLLGMWIYWSYNIWKEVK